MACHRKFNTKPELFQGDYQPFSTFGNMQQKQSQDGYVLKSENDIIQDYQQLNFELQNRVNQLKKQVDQQQETITQSQVINQQQLQQEKIPQQEYQQDVQKSDSSYTNFLQERERYEGIIRKQQDEIQQLHNRIWYLQNQLEFVQKRERNPQKKKSALTQENLNRLEKQNSAHRLSLDYVNDLNFMVLTKINSQKNLDENLDKQQRLEKKVRDIQNFSQNIINSVPSEVEHSNPSAKKQSALQYLQGLTDNVLEQVGKRQSEQLDKVPVKKSKNKKVITKDEYLEKIQKQLKNLEFENNRLKIDINTLNKEKDEILSQKETYISQKQPQIQQQVQPQQQYQQVIVQPETQQQSQPSVQQQQQQPSLKIQQDTEIVQQQVQPVTLQQPQVVVQSVNPTQPIIKQQRPQQQQQEVVKQVLQPQQLQQNQPQQYYQQQENFVKVIPQQQQKFIAQNHENNFQQELQQTKQSIPQYYQQQQIYQQPNTYIVPPPQQNPELEKKLNKVETQVRDLEVKNEILMQLLEREKKIGQYSQLQQPQPLQQSQQQQQQMYHHQQQGSIDVSNNNENKIKYFTQGNQSIVNNRGVPYNNYSIQNKKKVNPYI